MATMVSVGRGFVRAARPKVFRMAALQHVGGPGCRRVFSTSSILFDAEAGIQGPFLREVLGYHRLYTPAHPCSGAHTQIREVKRENEMDSSRTYCSAHAGRGPPTKASIPPSTSR